MLRRLFFWHLAVSLGLKDFLRGIPDEEATLRASGDDELLVGGDGNLKKRNMFSKIFK